MLQAQKFLDQAQQLRVYGGMKPTAGKLTISTHFVKRRQRIYRRLPRRVSAGPRTERQR